MPSAWQLLSANSTLSTGTAWQHLNAQRNVPGNTYLTGGVELILEPENTDIIGGGDEQTLDFGSSENTISIGHQSQQITIGITSNDLFE